MEIANTKFLKFSFSSTKNHLCNIHNMIRLIFFLLFLMSASLHGHQISAKPPKSIVTSPKISLFPRTRVYIYNNLGNIILKLHCKSKDDDLGIHMLKNGEIYSFKFRESLISTTRFTCNMEWKNVKGIFDVYLDRRDSKRCHDCVWKVTQNGIRGYSEEGKEEIWFRWVPKPPTIYIL